MHQATLRKVGGSVMLAVPTALLDVLHLKAGQAVGLDVSEGRLIVEPQPKPAYTLQQLLDQCDASAPQEGDAWTTSAAIGRELL